MKQLVTAIQNQSKGPLKLFSPKKDIHLLWKIAKAIPTNDIIRYSVTVDKNESISETSVNVTFIDAQ